MLRCPVCDGQTKVRQTGVRPKSGRLLATTLIHRFQVCYRVRHCKDCSWRGESIEVTFHDLLVLLTDTAKGFFQAHDHRRHNDNALEAEAPASPH